MANRSRSRRKRRIERAAHVGGWILTAVAFWPGRAVLAGRSVVSGGKSLTRFASRTTRNRGRPVRAYTPTHRSWWMALMAEQGPRALRPRARRMYGRHVGKYNIGGGL